MKDKPVILNFQRFCSIMRLKLYAERSLFMWEAMIFDLDGTLLNTLSDLENAINHTLKNYGYPERTTEEVRKFVGNGLTMLARRALPVILSDSDFDEFCREFVDFYHNHACEKTLPYPGVCDTIKRLYERNVKIAVVTNKAEDVSKNLIKTFFGDYIHVVVGAADGRQKKPDPAGVNEALQLLNVTDKSKVLYIGDSDVDAYTAENAGLKYALCLWGFRTEEQLQKFSPVKFLNEFDELLKL